MTYYTDDANKVEYNMDKVIDENVNRMRCMMCEEKEIYYKAGYEEGFKAGQSALSEGVKDEDILSGNTAP